MEIHGQQSQAPVINRNHQVVSAEVKDGKLSIKLEGATIQDVDRETCQSTAWDERHKHGFTQGSLNEVSPAYPVDAQAKPDDRDKEILPKDHAEFAKSNRLRYRRTVVIGVND